MRTFLCWLLGHDWKPITTFMTDKQKRQELERFWITGHIRWSKCARCGAEQ